MIDLVNVKPTIIIYHGNCADGYTAAWIAKKALREENIDAEMHAAVYGQPLPDVERKVVYLLDFSYPRAIMRELITKCTLLIWLDHHASAIAESGDFMPDVPFKDFGKVGGKLSADRSGAWLTWEHFYGPDAIPTMVQLVDDRDRWQFKLPRSKHFAAGLFSFRYQEDNWDYAAEHVEEVAKLGEGIERKEDKDAAELIDSCTSMKVINGNVVPCVNVPYMQASRVGHKLLELHPFAPFAATWYRRADGMNVYSLRSRQDSAVDVSVVAGLMGKLRGGSGGGHKHAAGYSIAVELDI